MDQVMECLGLTKTYGTGVVALSEINLQLPRGKIVGLLGPNGSGKTTLIKLACGLLTPTRGEIRICGHRPGTKSKELISFLPDREYLPDWMRVRDVMDYFRDFYRDFDPVKAREMMQRLQLDDKMRLKTLSKGTKEKVQLILVMSRKAKLYILDEPIGGVDPAARDYILDTIIHNYSEDATVLLSTHLIHDIERVLDTVVMIGYGKLMLAQDVEEIRVNQGKSVDELFRELYRI